VVKVPLLVSLALLGLAVAPPVAEAKGWEEVHQTSDDVRVTVGPDGVATVQHHLRYRVVAGHFKSLDFAGVDPHADLVAESTILPEKGGEIPARVEANPRSPGAVRILYDEPRGLGRGVYVVDVKLVDGAALARRSRRGTRRFRSAVGTDGAPARFARAGGNDACFAKA
jgi:hypothetical protein